VSENPLLYALSTIAQCAVALAALIGVFGMRRLDRHRDEARRLTRAIVEVTTLSAQNSREYARLRGCAHYLTFGRQLASEGHTELAPLYKQFDTLPDIRRRLLSVLIGFLTAMLVILAFAVIGFIFAKLLETWAVTPWLIGLAGLCLGIGPACVVWQAARYQEVGHEPQDQLEET
jgi:hypothetical protein